MAKCFDTYTSSGNFDDFISLPVNQGISEGFIIIAAAKDDCVSALSPKAKEWFTELGSKQIKYLEYQEGFSFIGIVGRK